MIDETISNKRFCNFLAHIWVNEEIIDKNTGHQSIALEIEIRLDPTIIPYLVQCKFFLHTLKIKYITLKQESPINPTILLTARYIYIYIYMAGLWFFRVESWVLKTPNESLWFNPALIIILSLWSGTKCATMFWGRLPFVTMTFDPDTKCNNILTQNHGINIAVSETQHRYQRQM